LALQDNLGWTALHHLCALSADCDELVLHLLEVKPNVAKIKTKKGDTALHVAADSNPSALVAQKLVELYPDAITARNDYGYTPLHIACRALASSVSFICILLEADSDVMTMRTNSEELPIHLICQKSQVSPEVLGVFLEKIPSDYNVDLPRSGHNPLHEACLHRLPLELIELICEQKPSWATAKNLQGQTPLHLIIKISRGGIVDMGIIQTLVRVGGAQQINSEDNFSHTPFLSALREDASLELIAFLLEAAPEAVNGVHSYCVGHHKSVGTPLEVSVVRDVPTAVLNVVVTAGDAPYITLPNAECIAPLETIMYKVHRFRNVNHAFTYFERLHRAFLLVGVALGRCSTGESWNDEGVTTSISLLDLLSLRRKFGSEYVAGELLDHVTETTAESSVDADGNTPLHIEVAVSQTPSRGEVKLRPFGAEERTKNHLLSILRRLIEVYPTNFTSFNDAGELPFDVMIKSDRSWDSGIALIVKKCPEAVTAWLERQNSPERLLPTLLENVTQHCGIATTFQLLRNMPKVAAYYR